MVRYTRLAYEETHMMQEREEEVDATTAATAVESATEPVGTVTTIRTPAAMESAPAATTIRTTAATEPMGTVTTIRTTAVMEPAPAVTEPMGTTIAMGPAGTSRMATATSWTVQAETCLEAPGNVFGVIALALLSFVIGIYYALPHVYHVFVSGTHPPLDAQPTHVVLFMGIAVVCIVAALVTRPTSSR